MYIIAAGKTTAMATIAILFGKPDNATLRINISPTKNNVVSM